MTQFSRSRLVLLLAVCGLFGFVGLAGAGRIDVRVADGPDDAEEHLSDNSIDLTSSDLELGEQGGAGDFQEIGMRFLNIDIPAGAKINSATIQFTTDETDTEDTSVLIFGELSPNPTTFTTATGDITNRPKTTSSVQWNNIPPWLVVGEAGPNQQTPDFKTVVQEIVDQPGWAANNAMVIIIPPNPGGERTAESFNGDEAAAPLLSIIFDETLLLTIDRDTGSLSLANDATGEEIDFLGYSITSDAGALDQSGWTSVSGNYDAPSNGGDGSVDSDDEWTILTAAGARTDLSETELMGGDGGVIGAGDSIDFGTAWTKSPIEDLQMEILLTSGETPVVSVDFVGNGGAPFAVGDLNFDGVIDTDDWQVFRDGLGGDYTSLGLVKAYQMGDLDGDLDTDLADFLIFEGLFNAAVGPNALANLTAVPEPSTLLLLTIAGLGLLTIRRLRITGSRLAVLFAICGLFGLVGLAEADVIEIRVAAGSDDAEEQWSDNAVDLGSSDLELGEEGGSGDFQDVGMRFLDIGILPGSTIHSATIQFTTDETDDEDTSVLIYGELSPNATTFTNTVGDISSRPQTTSSVEWNDIPQWQVVGEAGPNQRTPDFSAVVQEIIDQPDWDFNNAMVVIIGPNPGGERTAESFNGDATAAPLLNIDFTPRFDLSLEVDRGTGAASMMNISGEAATMNGYQITSAAGSLDPAGWDSFEDQNLPGFPAGDGTGDGWEEGGSVNPNSLVEAYLQGTSTVAIGASMPLGSLFSAGGAAEDLFFHYSFAGAIRRGDVQYVGEAIEFPLGDVNLDGEVNGLDVDPFVDVLLNGPFQIEADMNTDGVVNGLDVDPFVEAVVGGGVQAVPEPSTLALVALAGLAMVLRISKGGRLMNRFSFMSVLAAGLLVAVIGSTSQADFELDRAYLFGDNTGVPAQNENATAGQKIGSGAGGVTFDTESVSNNPGNDNDAQNLSPTGAAGPKYVGVGQGLFQRTAADGDPNPPATGDLGAQFNGSGEYLRSARLGFPETAAGTLGYGNVPGGAVWNPNDYTGISNRGYQLWVYPTSNAAAQSVVMDTNQHGVRISAAGNWSMRYNGADVDSATSVATDQWSHVMLVRPFGSANGSRLYVDGIVVAAVGGGYNGDDNASLVLGSNTSEDADGNFDGGTEEFFSGVMDNLEMFVLGTTTSDPSTDYGTFDPQTDNQFIAGAMAGVPDGDVNMNGILEPVADVDAFVAGWLSSNVVNGMQVGDLGSRALGDLNFDGITDLSDAFVLHEALSAAGGGLDFSALTAAVPEPSTLLLLSLAVVVGLLWRRR